MRGTKFRTNRKNMTSCDFMMTGGFNIASPKAIQTTTTPLPSYQESFAADNEFEAFIKQVLNSESMKNLFQKQQESESLEKPKEIYDIIIDEVDEHINHKSAQPKLQ